MSSLERLASKLRRELGEPPHEFPEARRARLRGASARPRPGLRAAALLAAATALGILVLWSLGGREPAGVTAMHATNAWLTSETTPDPYRLPDGSTIHLARGASGRLAASEQGARFHLQEGKATFYIRHRPEQHWTVVAGPLEVTVIGTRFSVELGPHDTVEVRVEQGSVDARAPGRNDAIRLTAGDRLRSDAGRIALDRVDRVDSVAAEAPTVASKPPLRRKPATVESAAPSAAPRPTSIASDWRALYRDGKYALALARAKRQGFERLARAADAPTLAALADTARLGGDPALAATTLRALERRFPGSPQAAAGRFLLGRIHALQGNRAAATHAFEEYLRSSPGGTYANEAIGRLMDLYAAQGNAPRAQAMARRYVKLAPQGPYRQLADSLLGQR